MYRSRKITCTLPRAMSGTIAESIIKPNRVDSRNATPFILIPDMVPKLSRFTSTVPFRGNVPIHAACIGGKLCGKMVTEKTLNTVGRGSYTLRPRYIVKDLLQGNNTSVTDAHLPNDSIDTFRALCTPTAELYVPRMKWFFNNDLSTCNWVFPGYCYRGKGTVLSSFSLNVEAGSSSQTMQRTTTTIKLRETTLKAILKGRVVAVEVGKAGQKEAGNFSRSGGNILRRHP
ncbi:hypothetical protein EV360DRAFT_74599 [Lentinula raphanica]|nr:hypothetical protein EV360DRAFT_74599 [Lentinula raphanica]